MEEHQINELQQQIQKKINNVELIVQCPQCNEYVEIESVNCGIFRHIQGINGEQVNPHLGYDQCQLLIKSDKYYGCGTAFKIDKDTLQVSLCSYEE